MKWHLFRIFALWVAVTFTPTLAQALNVSGTVQDSNNLGIPGMRVEVYDEDLFFDNLIETVYTAANGSFLTTLATAGDDIYVIAKWELS